MSLIIRPAQSRDLATIMKLWLEGNLAAHDYIPARFWLDHEPAVRQAISESHVWVAEENTSLLGFIGLTKDHIAGLFVAGKAQNQGVGGKLITHLQANQKRLNLTVYQKNTGAIHFYQQHGFSISHSQMDEATGEREYWLTWEQDEKDGEPLL